VYSRKVRALGEIMLNASVQKSGRLNDRGEPQCTLKGGYTYSNFLMNMLGIFAFVVWFWLLVIIYGDLFRRHDISGWGKALWVIALVLTSYLGIFAYLITQGRGMAERSTQQQQQAREECVVWSVSARPTKLPNSIS
jgi:hypothetical protein